MIEISRTIPNPEKLTAWLEEQIRPYLTPDVSNYAKGRLRVWLNTEPTLSSPTRILRSRCQVEEKILSRLAEIIEWDFDFALVTYSGDETPTGISQHRDASYADYEAVGLHLSGECLFQYWCDRESFGWGPSSGKVLHSDEPTHKIELVPGQLVRFNCKNLHAASPGLRRWNINFWKQKPAK